MGRDNHPVEHQNREALIREGRCHQWGVRSALVLPSSRGLEKLGAILYAGATLQCAGAQLTVAPAWNPPDDWANNCIGDLGNTACGMFSVPHGTPAFVCSPVEAALND